jgi:hypothetical protein
MSTIAAFLGLGGGAYAVTNVPEHSVGTKQLKRGSVGTRQLKHHSVTESKLAPGSVGSPEISKGAVGSPQVADGSLSATDLAPGTISLPAVQDTENSAMSLSPTPAIVASTQVTAPAATSSMLSFGDLTLQETAKGQATVQYQVLVDGQPQGPTFTQDLQPGQTAVVPVALIVSVAPGTHTVQIQAQVVAGSASVQVRNVGVVAGVRTCGICFASRRLAD